MTSVFHREHFDLLTPQTVQKSLNSVCSEQGPVELREEERICVYSGGNVATTEPYLCLRVSALLSLVFDVWSGSHAFVLPAEGVSLFTLVFAYL